MNNIDKQNNSRHSYLQLTVHVYFNNQISPAVPLNSKTEFVGKERQADSIYSGTFHQFKRTEDSVVDSSQENFKVYVSAVPFCSDGGAMLAVLPHSSGPNLKI